MGKTFTASAGVCIEAPASQVWKALTDPELIQKYLFGTRASSDWKVGSPVTWSGVWQGKPYEDKGRVLEVVEHKLLKTTYWSSLSSRPDTPESYNTVSWTLAEKHGHTTLKVEQDNNPTPESAEHSERNWKAVLESLKAVLEGNTAGGVT